MKEVEKMHDGAGWDWFGFFLMITILSIAFQGDPDLVDVTIKYVERLSQ